MAVRLNFLSSFFLEPSHGCLHAALSAVLTTQVCHDGWLDGMSYALVTGKWNASASLTGCKHLSITISHLKYSRDCTFNSEYKIRGNVCPNYQYNFPVNGLCQCPKNLSKLGGLFELSVPELTDLYCNNRHIIQRRLRMVCTSGAKVHNELSK